MATSYFHRWYTVDYWILHILGPTQPVGVHCPMPLTSSLGEFPGYSDCSGIVARVAVHRLLYLGIFHSLFFTCHWISFVFLPHDRRICTHSIDPSLADGELPRMKLTLVPVVMVPEAERVKQKSRFKFLP